MCGGSFGNRQDDAVQLLDVRQPDRMVTLRSLPIAVAAAGGSCLLRDDQVLVLGGRISDTALTAAAQFFDIRADRWLLEPAWDLSVPLLSHGLVSTTLSRADNVAMFGPPNMSAPMSAATAVDAAASAAP